MLRFVLRTCLTFLCVLSVCGQDTVLNPRGARPVEHGTRSEKCDSQPEWPFCTSDEMGPKCPSGCRIQGLMNKYDHNLLKKIEKIRGILAQNEQKHRSTDTLTKETYDYVKDQLRVDSGHSNNYFDLAQSLRQRIVSMKIKIDRQLGILAALKERVKDQVAEMQRLEVDIDIRLRSCKGSCERYSEYQVDQESYVALDKQVNQLDSQRAQSIETAGSLSVMKSKPLRDALVESIYKSGVTEPSVGQQTQDMFPDVDLVHLAIESEGSLESPATVSKDPGTAFNAPTTSSSSSSSSTSSSSSSSSSSITELGGNTDLFSGAFEGFQGLSQDGTTHVATKTVSCTRSTRRVTVQGPLGPEERLEEVVEGGPECQNMAGHSKGGMSTLFPTYTGGAKGSMTVDTKSFGGIDLGAFMTGDVDEDVPDFHARSVKTTRVEREADFVGKDCVEANKKHLKGETNGLFEIRPSGVASSKVVVVYCHQEGVMGGWLLAQQREGGELSFNRSWAEYRDGFGSVNALGKGEFWLGNQNLHLLTNQGETMLKVELEDWEGAVATAEYIVRIGSEEEGYALHASQYVGDAGDALMLANSAQSADLSSNGMRFSTFDKDQDRSEQSCAEMFGGGWWYNNCQAANLNGVYYRGVHDSASNTPNGVLNGVLWPTFKGSNYSLKTARMFIRSSAF